MTTSVDPDQTAPTEAVCSGSTLFDSILNSSVMLGNYLQQTTSADDIIRCVFFLGTLRVNRWVCAYAMRTKISCACTYIEFVHTLENHCTRKVQSSRFGCSQRRHSMYQIVKKVTVFLIFYLCKYSEVIYISSFISAYNVTRFT